MSSQASRPSDPREYTPVSLRDTNAESPSGRYMDADDKIRVSIQSLVAVTAGVRVRWQDLDGGIHIQDEVATPTAADGTVTTVDFSLGAGYVLSVTGFVESGTPRRGQCFMSAGLVRNGFLAETFFADALVQSSPLGWPYGQIRQSVEGPGNMRVVVGNVPAAGAQIAFTVPANTRWRIQAFRAALTTSAGVANRNVHLQVQDAGGNVVNDCPSSGTQAASLVRGYDFSPCGFFANALDGEFTCGIPPVVLSVGMKLVTTVTLMDVADQWTAPKVLVEEWVEL